MKVATSCGRGCAYCGRHVKTGQMLFLWKGYWHCGDCYREVLDRHPGALPSYRNMVAVRTPGKNVSAAFRDFRAGKPKRPRLQPK